MDRSLRAKVTGVDHSPVSVEKSRKVNAYAILESRCKVLEASVASLPFKDETFAMATAFETVYFWPDIIRSFAEVRRVLVLGGILLIVNEDDGLSGNNEKWEKMIEGMHTYTPDELVGPGDFTDVVGYNLGVADLDVAHSVVVASVEEENDDGFVHIVFRVLFVLSYFSRYCSKHLGRSPSEYRLSLQPKQRSVAAREKE